MVLNFFFLPMGYLYLKDSRRFVAGALYTFFATALFSLLAWLLPLLLPVWSSVPVLWGLSLLILATILVDTYRLSKKPSPEKAWRVFSKPHVFWFIPVYWIVMIVLAAATAPWEKPFAQAHNIPSPSMEPNLQVGDFVFVSYVFDKTALKHSDIIIHEDNRHFPGKKLVKRIIGMPGDTLHLLMGEIKGPEGETYTVLRYKLNGKLVPLQYDSEGAKRFKLQTTSTSGKNAVFRETVGAKSYAVLEEPHGIFFRDDALGESKEQTIRLGPDEFFVLGDNRDHAADSRQDGPIKLSQIKGKYMHTYFSFYVPNSACELGHGVMLFWHWATAKKHSPCGGMEIRWEKAGYLAQ